MRVLFLVRRFHTNMIPMVEALQSRDHTVVIVGALREVVEDYTLIEPRIVEPMSIDETAARALVEELRPDVVVLRDTRGGYPLVARLAAEKGARTVLYNQEPYTRGPGPRGLKRDVERLVSQVRAHLPRRTITPVYGVPGAPAKLLTTFFRFPMGLPDTPVTRDLSPNAVPTILCVGKLAQPRKRHGWLLDALELLDVPCRVVLAGAGNDLQFDDGTRSLGYYTSLLERCARMTGRVRAEVFQNLSYHEAKRLYASAHVFVLPSEKEDAAISPLEAMAAGCAVLLPDANGTTCYATHGLDSRIFREQDYGDFVEQLRVLLTSPDTVASLGANASHTIQAHHNFDSFVDMLLGV